MNLNLLKKLLAVVALSIYGLMPAYPVVACPEPAVVTQPDGSTVTLHLFGDEHFSFTLTSAGAPVLFNPSAGCWEFAMLRGGELVTTGVVASDSKAAPASASQDARTLQSLFRKARATAPQLPGLVGSRSAAPDLQKLKTGQYDYSKFRGLVILVEYNDCPFSRDDILEVFTDMVTKKDYDGYMSNHILASLIPCTGSVRDYYFENSNGMFDPSFDVVGPVKIDYSQDYARKSSGAQMLVTAALRAADELIDYKEYDTDGNREVDMVYFIFSGGGSNFSGNPETLIWPHASTVMNLSLDGVSFGRYACSTELYGQPANKLLDGIGTICHEFSHVLGLPDLYDVDYETGGQAVHPAKWSIMASGSYLNKSKTPCGYSLFERYALGFTNPRLITTTGNYSVAPLNEGDYPDGCRINSAVKDEFFLIESRRKTRWDEYLPGEGMLVTRVDSTNTSAWENNKVNESPTHTYLTLLRANPKVSGSTVTDSDGDPFPGSGNVTSLTNATSPSMRSWTMVSTPLVLDDIAVSDDGTASFTVIADNVPTLREDFASIPDSLDFSKDFTGRFTDWNISKGAAIVTDPESGQSMLTTVKGAEVLCRPFGRIVENIAVKITNNSSSGAIFRLSSSNDAQTWRGVPTVEGSSNPTVRAGESVIIHYNTGTLTNASYKLVQFTGSTSSPCYVDAVEFGVKADTSAVDRISSDAPQDMPGEEKWFSADGMPVAAPSAPGLYIRVSSSKTEKIIF